jgi:protein-disulfide isomerase
LDKGTGLIMNKQFTAIIVVVIVALIGVFSITNKKENSQKSSTNNTQASTSSHTVGAGNKKVTLIEYGDFECPACKAYYPLVKEIKQTYGDDITFQFRNFPLNQIHPNAFLGSRAAEAAGKQGKFFEMHDLLYENQDTWSKASNPTSVLQTFAQQLGLNVDQFKNDMMSSTTSDVINADIKEGQAIKATSTPTFVLNGKKIEENPRSVEDFKKLIDDAIAKANPNS